MTKTWKLRFIVFLFLFTTFTLLLLIAEFIAKKAENVSGNFKHNEHSILGWVPRPGNYWYETAEFKTSISINSLTLRDRPFDKEDLELEHRILVLGDSHTIAAEVSNDDTWPNKMEKLLFPTGTEGTIYNAGVSGYSVGQYLERYQTLKEILKPTHIIVGFSMATDLYDLIPPERGGFIYGGNKERSYFDLDYNGELVTKYYFNKNGETSRANYNQLNFSQKLRNYLGNFALYRRVKRSKLAMWVAVNYRPSGNSLWPGTDTALKINLSEDDYYCWQLAEAILGQLVLVAKLDGISVTIVNIPYLAQVYDDVWESSFGRKKNMYDRWVASKRLQALSKKIGAGFIDTTPEFVKMARETNQWLHYHQDAHPTVEGHALIARLSAKHIQKYLMY